MPLLHTPIILDSSGLFEEDSSSSKAALRMGRLLAHERMCSPAIRDRHGVRREVQKKGRRLVVIWDGAPWHRAKLVQQAAEDLGIELIALPGYSPDLNPIEGLWKWMRQEVTQLCCYSNLKALFDACKSFVETINTNPLDLVNRLWPKFELDPEEEKLGFST